MVHTAVLTLCINPSFSLHVGTIRGINTIPALPKDLLFVLYQKSIHLCIKCPQQEKPVSVVISFVHSPSPHQHSDLYHITFVLLFVKSTAVVWMCSWTSSNSFAATVACLARTEVLVH